LVRWSAITTLLTDGMWWGLIAVAVLSRAPMAVLMAVMPNARGKGLAQSVGHVPLASAGVAALIGLAAAGCLGWSGLWMVLATAMVVLALALVARAKIGGQTGDILGASQQIAEAAGLVVLAATL
jgi:adenosylcobinamide-GDP ribazoletransferase